MVWHDLRIGNFKGKYTPLNPIEEDFENCDSQGNILKRVSGSFTKGYYINEATGEKFDSAYKLIKGQPTAKFTGRTKETDRVVYLPIEECGDLITEKEFIFECKELYEHLKAENKGVKVGLHFGNGYKKYKVIITPNPLYDGFCDMRGGRTAKSEVLGDVVGELKEHKRKAELLKEIENSLSKVKQLKDEDFDL